MARIFDAVRGPHFAVLLVLAALAVAAVPALADPGASASGGASASSEVVVKRGDRGSAVRSIQQELGIRADGVFGAQTERAVKRFQRSHDLVPDGIVGPLTRGALGLRPFSSRSVRRTSGGSVSVPAVLQADRRVRVRGQPARRLTGRAVPRQVPVQPGDLARPSAAAATRPTRPSGSRTGLR